MALSQSVHARTLRRAAEVIGGFEALAAYLDVRPMHLQAWMNGTLETPTDVFLKVVDFLMQEHLAVAEGKDLAGCSPFRRSARQGSNAGRVKT